MTPSGNAVRRARRSIPAASSWPRCTPSARRARRTSSLTSASPPAARTRATSAMSVAPSMPPFARTCTSRIPPRSNASVNAIGSTRLGSTSAYTPRKRERGASPLLVVVMPDAALLQRVLRVDHRDGNRTGRAGGRERGPQAGSGDLARLRVHDDAIHIIRLENAARRGRENRGREEDDVRLVDGVDRDVDPEVGDVRVERTAPKRDV